MSQSQSSILQMPRDVEHVRLDNGFSSLRACLVNALRDCDTSNDGMRLNIQEPDGEGFIEFFEFHPQFNVIVSQCRWTAEQVVKYDGEGWLRFNFCLDTTASFLFDDNARYDLSGAECRIFHHPVGMDCGHFLTSGSPSVCATVSIKRDYLMDRLQLPAEAMSDPLRSFLEGEHKDFFFERLTLSPSMREVVAQMLLTRYAGNLRRTFIEAKSMELICHAFDDACFPEREDVIPFRFDGRDRSLVESARTILDNALDSCITVPQLARRVGLNRNKLTYGFKHLYGISVFDYHTKIRFDAAWKLLQETDLSIADISHKVGYQHQASFTVAFKQRFGVTPKDARKIPD